MLHLQNGVAESQNPMDSGTRFRAVFEQAPISMQLLAADGRTMQVNKAWETLWQISEGDGIKEYVLGAEYNVLSDPQLKAKGITPYLLRAFSGEPVTIPAIYYDPTELGSFGRARWVRAKAHPIKDQQGRVQEVMLMHDDITDRVNAENTLRSSEERFRSFVTSTSHVVWIADDRGAIVEDSPSWRAFTGQTYEEVMGLGWLDAIHPEDREHAGKVWMECVANRNIYEIDYRVKNAAGQYRWTKAKGVPLFNADGSAREWVGTNTDVTESLESRKLLDETKERLEAALIAGEVATWVWDISDNLVFADRNLARIFGFAESDAALAKPVERYLQVIHSEDRERVVKTIAQDIASGSSVFRSEYRVVRSAGDIRAVIARGRIDRDAAGKAVRMPGVILDVTERARAEQAVQESEKKLRAGLIAARMAVWDWDLRAGTVEFAANSHAAFGHAWATEAEGWNVVHPDDRAPLRAAIDDAIARRGHYEMAVRMVRPVDNETIWVEIRGEVECDGSGNAVSIRGVFLDVTDRKRAEEALRVANRRKDEFLAMLAHELRNPLSPISAASALLAMGDTNKDRVLKTSKIISRQVEHITKIVDDLLDVSRVTRGLVTIQREPLDLRDIVRMAVEQVTALIDERHHHLTLEIAPEPARVDGDSTRLIQIVTNLLNNAAKYTPAGGSIGLSVEVGANDVEVIVKDNGIGLSQELLPHVFELFVQGERTSDRSQGGLGLGLALVKNMVSLHGGSVLARSEGLGKGSEFIIRLPRSVDSAQSDNASDGSDGNEQASTALAVLVVDDNVDAAQTMAMLLEMHGHRVWVEYGAADALKQVEREMPQVLILDIGLPDMDGYELARRIRSNPAAGKSTFIALTGYGQTNDREQSKLAGFDYHLVKPVDTKRLAAILAGLLDRNA